MAPPYFWITRWTQRVTKSGVKGLMNLVTALLTPTPAFPELCPTRHKLSKGCVKRYMINLKGTVGRRPSRKWKLSSYRMKKNAPRTQEDGWLAWSFKLVIKLYCFNFLFRPIARWTPAGRGQFHTSTMRCLWKQEANVTVGFCRGRSWRGKKLWGYTNWYIRS